jgi:glutaredoxin
MPGSRSPHPVPVLLALALLAAGCEPGSGQESRVAALWQSLAERVGLAPEEPGARSVPAPARVEPTAAGAEALPDEPGADESEPAAGPGYWRYTEPNGSLRFVQSFAEVPASARGTAERIATAAPRPAAARPVAAPRRTRPAWTAPSEPPRRSDTRVIVYTAPWCGWCRKTLAWLDERGVDYEDRDIERNAEWGDELERKTGGRSIPVVDVDGRLVRGFDPGTLERLL